LLLARPQLLVASRRWLTGNSYPFLMQEFNAILMCGYIEHNLDKVSNGVSFQKRDVERRLWYGL